MRAALGAGTRLLMGTVNGLTFGEGGAVRGAVVDGQEVAGDAVVIAMGPWSVLASRWLPLPAVYGLKGHSLLFRYAPEPVPHALFVELETEKGTLASPEVFPRPDGTTYVCGLSSEAPLPVDPAAVAPDEGGTARLRAMTTQFSPALGEAEVLTEQACYRPVVEDGLPLIGAVPSIDGAYVATAHSVWGMLNAPATGEPRRGPRALRSGAARSPRGKRRADGGLTPRAAATQGLCSQTSRHTQRARQKSLFRLLICPRVNADYPLSHVRHLRPRLDLSRLVGLHHICYGWQHGGSLSKKGTPASPSLPSC